tara:strand:+ start:605 stop:1297 length:693 start_codon:yes stop_codon:yes gene_type:complete
MKDLNKIQEFFLNENVYMEAYKLEKALKGMGYDVKVKYEDDFGTDVFEIYSKKPLDDDSIFYDAKKLGYPNARVFDHSNEGINEVEIGDKVKIDKDYGGGKGKIEDKVGSFVIVNGKSYHESDVEKTGLEEGTSKYRKGYSNQKGFSPQLVSPENPRGETSGLTTDTMNKILMKVIQDLDELKQLGEGMIEEKLCKKGQAYRKKRMAAGEKSSAYLNGRAVKVCKGQMKG